MFWNLAFNETYILRNINQSINIRLLHSCQIETIDSDTDMKIMSTCKQASSLSQRRNRCAESCYMDINAVYNDEMMMEGQ